MSKNKNKACNALNEYDMGFKIENAQNEYNKLAKSSITLDKYKFYPPRVCEIAETLNKFCLYVKGTSGRIFKLYMELIDRNMELLKLEQEKYIQECKIKENADYTIRH